MDQLLKFGEELSERRARFLVSVDRSDAVMVSLYVPGELWEIEFFNDGRIEVERFLSQGVEVRPDVLNEALRFFDE